jgi:hypothetical protein
VAAAFLVSAGAGCGLLDTGPDLQEFPAPYALYLYQGLTPDGTRDQLLLRSLPARWCGVETFADQRVADGVIQLQVRGVRERPGVNCDDLQAAQAFFDLGRIPRGTYQLHLRIGQVLYTGTLTSTSQRLAIWIPPHPDFDTSSAVSLRLPEDSLWGFVAWQTMPQDSIRYEALLATFYRNGAEPLELAPGTYGPFSSSRFVSEWFQVTADGTLRDLGSIGSRRPFVFGWHGDVEEAVDLFAAFVTDPTNPPGGWISLLDRRGNAWWNSDFEQP